MSKIDKTISEALGIEWNGENYQDFEITDEDRRNRGAVLDENGKDMTNAFYGRSNKGKYQPPHSEEAKRKMKGRTPWNKGMTGGWGASFAGQKHSEESLEKMRQPKSEAHKQKLRGPRAPYRDEIKIECCGKKRDPGNHARHLKSKHR